MSSSFRVALMLILMAPVSGWAQNLPAPESVRLEFDGAAVVVQGTRLDLPVEYADLVRLLGKPDRVFKLANTISTWDHMGVLAYRRPNSEQVCSVVVCFGPKKFEFWPHAPFGGNFFLDGVPVAASTSIEQVNSQRGDSRLVFDRLQKAWRYRTDKYVVFCSQADDDKPSAEHGRIVAISIDMILPEDKKDQELKFEFIRLLGQVRQGTAEADYGALRMAYAKTPWYHPEEAEATMRERMLRSVEAQNYSDALGVAKFLLGQNLNFLDIQAHLVAERAFEKLGQVHEAQAHRRHYRGLIDSILASGDGKSPTTAYVVISTQEMAAVLQYLGLSHSADSRTTLSDKDACLFRVSARDSRQTEIELYFKLTVPCFQIERHSQSR